MLPRQEFEIKNWSGGLNECVTGLNDQYHQADNLFLTIDQQWVSVPGSVAYDSNAACLPSGTSKRVGRVINFNENELLFAQSGNQLFYYSSGAWNEVKGPTNNAALIGATTSGNLSVCQWKKHLFFTSDEQILPVKVVKNNGSWVAYTSGLPVMATPKNYIEATVLTSAVNLANALRTKFQEHFNDIAHQNLGTIPHHEWDTESDGMLTASAATNLSTLLTLVSQLIKSYSSHYKDAESVGVYHWPFQPQSVTMTIGPTDISWMKLDSTEMPTDLPGAVKSLNDIAVKFNTHIGDPTLHNPAFLMSPVGSLIYGVTSGPSVELDRQYIYSFARQIGTRYNSHLSDGGAAAKAHSTAADATNTVTFPAGTSDPDTETRNLIYNLRLAYGGKGSGSSYGHEFDAAKGAGWTFHVNKETSNHNLSTGMVSDSTGVYPNYGGLHAGDYAHSVTVLNDLKNTINAHMSDLKAHYTNNPASIYPGGYTLISTYINAEDLALANYNYAFVYQHTYKIDQTEYQIRSEPLYVEASQILKIGIQNAAINNIPILDNGTNLSPTSNYDTSNIKIEIYRTVDNGTTYFLVDTIANADTSGIGAKTTSYSDGVTDEELLTRETLYTTGGVLPNAQPPKAKFMHVVNNLAYYANTQDNPNRIIQSYASGLDQVYGGNYVDLPQEVKGMSSAKGNLIAWTEFATYRIEGSFDETGQGSMSAVCISGATGLSAPHSPVEIDDGVAFFGNDGVYFTDGYRVTKINKYWRDTYLNLVSTSSKKKSVCGAHDKANKRIWWAVNASSSDNDSCYVLDLNFPLNDNCVFTSMTGGTSFAPASVCYFNGQMIRGDTRGYVFKHDPQYTNNPKIDNSKNLTGTTNYINYTFKSPSYDFGSAGVRKWASQMMLKAQPIGTNLSIQLISNNDNSRVVSNLAPIRYRGGASNMIEEKRKFPAGSMRFGSKQIQFTNAKVVMHNSDSLGMATLNKAAKTLTLAAGNWPTDLADQFITFATDNYTTEWSIVSVAGGVMSISDPGGTLPASGSLKWEVKGYPKDESINVVSYSIFFSPLGTSQSSAVNETGSNS